MTMGLQESFEEALRGLAVSSRLQKHIDHFTILVDRTPEIVLPTPDLHEDLIDKEGISVALMYSPESPDVLGSKLDAPEPNGFVGDRAPSRGQ
jgi:hypothetical protein